MVKDNLVIILYGLVILLVVGTIGFVTFIDYTNEQTVVCKVSEKWVKRKSNDDLYLVSCGEEVYKIDDLFFKGKFNSSNLYADIEVGKTYEIEVTGHRIPFFSMYQNINEYKEIVEE